LELGITMERSTFFSKGVTKAVKQSISEAVEELIQELIEERKVYNKEEAAEFCRLKVSALERYAFRNHEIAYSKAGKSAVFLRQDLLKFLEKRRIPSIYDEGV